MSVCGTIRSEIEARVQVTWNQLRLGESCEDITGDYADARLPNRPVIPIIRN